VPATDAMLLDRLLPDYDATRVDHRIVAGEQDAVYRAVMQADFMRAWSDSPAVRVLFGARQSVERVTAAARGRQVESPEEPAGMRVADVPSHGEWVLLGEDAPNEVAFGAIGRFWSGETTWEQIDAADFGAFDRAGFGKIACNFSLRPYGSGRTLVSYEARTQATDEGARRGFMRYWRPLAPFIGVVMRSQLRVIADQATDAQRGEPG
jgi:hypothetical protein